MTSIASITSMLLIGLITGISTDLTGASRGMMILFALIFILKFPLHKAISTSTLIMAITALSGARRWRFLRYPWNHYDIHPGQWKYAILLNPYK